MIEATMTLRDGALVPFSVEDAETLAELVPGAPVRVKVAGIRKPRSVAQLRLLYAALRTVADNTDNPELDDTEKVKFQLKLALKYVHGFVVPEGYPIQVMPRSFGFKELPHMEACRLFDRAWPVLADWAGCTVLELTDNAEYGA